MVQNEIESHIVLLQHSYQATLNENVCSFHSDVPKIWCGREKGLMSYVLLLFNVCIHFVH